MKNAEGRPRRRSLRLKDYDYSQEGAYFMTVCVQDRRCLFGEVVGGVMQLNDTGHMVADTWLELAHKFPSVETDCYVLMPNHFHGIITIVGTDHRAYPDSVGADLRVRPTQGAHVGAPLPKILQWFKTMTTNAYIHGVKHHGWPPFPGRLWQRNYYDHIIRNETELTRIREYIVNNPLQWALDREHPGNVGAQFIAPASDDIADIFGGVRP